MLSFIRVVLVMVSLQSNRTLTKTEVNIREWGIAVTGLAMLFVEEI